MTEPAPKPCVSIVIVTRNRGKLLQRAIDSVVAQDYRPLELVIVDNNSDEPVSFVAGDVPARRHTNPSMLSASKNRNIGISLATGEFVCFLDDDDVYLPGKVSKVLSTILGNDIAYCNTQMEGAEGKYLGICRGLSELPQVMNTRHIHLNSLMVRRSILKEIKFDEGMSTYEDVDFVFRLLRARNAHHCDEVLAVWHRDGRPDQLTNKNWARARANWLILCERFAQEINAHPTLAKLYYRKMFLLSGMCFRPLAGLYYFTLFVKFGLLGRRSA